MHGMNPHMWRLAHGQGPLTPMQLDANSRLTFRISVIEVVSFRGDFYRLKNRDLGRLAADTADSERTRNWSDFTLGGFYRRSQHFLDSGGCVVVLSSCEDGAGAASAVGQASAVHGTTRTRMEHPRRGSLGRSFPYHGEQLVTRLPDLPPRSGRRIGICAGAAGGASD